MKKLLFFPLLLLVFFSVTSCDKDKDEPTPELTATEQTLIGNWKMHTSSEVYYNDANGIMHQYDRANANDLIEYKTDGTVRFKGEEATDWGSRKYKVDESGQKKTVSVMKDNGTDVETVYTIEKLTATEMTLVDAYDYASYKDQAGNDVTSRRVVKTFHYSKL